MDRQVEWNGRGGGQGSPLTPAEYTMVNQRTFLPHSYQVCLDNESIYCPDDMQSSDMFLCCRLYQPMSPKNVTVHTRCASPNPQSPHYPCVERALDYPKVQSHVHDVYVAVKHGRIITPFRVFFKRHTMLPLSGYLGVHGDVLIMRVASRNNASVVNMRSTDGRLADYVAEK